MCLEVCYLGESVLRSYELPAVKILLSQKKMEAQLPSMHMKPIVVIIYVKC